MDDSGGKIENQGDIEDHCVDYFSGLLGEPASAQQFEQSDLDLLFDFACTEEDRSGFCKDFTVHEIKEEFFSLPRNKASGPDGYSLDFFKAAWSIIGQRFLRPSENFSPQTVFSSNGMRQLWF